MLESDPRCSVTGSRRWSVVVGWADQEFLARTLQFDEPPIPFAQSPDGEALTPAVFDIGEVLLEFGEDALPLEHLLPGSGQPGSRRPNASAGTGQHWQSI
jgi:hypothetical protein